MRFKFHAFLSKSARVLRYELAMPGERRKELAGAADTALLNLLEIESQIVFVLFQQVFLVVTRVNAIAN
jgi:hypothetical protein